MLALMERYGNPFCLAVISVESIGGAEPSDNVATERLLRSFGQCLRGTARETDIVHRYTDDEFVIVLPETNLNGATRFAMRLLHVVKQDVHALVSIGLAQALLGDSARTITNRADAALFGAKEEGKSSAYRHNGYQIELVGEAAISCENPASNQSMEPHTTVGPARRADQHGLACDNVGVNRGGAADEAKDTETDSVLTEACS